MGSSPGSLGLSRARRIRHARDFQRTKTRGRRITQGCLVLNWLPLEMESSSRLGVITARALGGAVVRNRARRLLRESFRLHQQHLARPADIVLVARPSIVTRGLDEVQKDYLEALRRAGLIRQAGLDDSPARS